MTANLHPCAPPAPVGGSRFQRRAAAEPAPKGRAEWLDKMPQTYDLIIALDVAPESSNLGRAAAEELTRP